MYIKITQSEFSSLTWCHCCLGQPLPAEMTLAQLLTLLYDRKLPQGYRSIDLTVKLGSKVISDPSLSKTDSFKRLHTEKGECSYFWDIVFILDNFFCLFSWWEIMVFCIFSKMLQYCCSGFTFLFSLYYCMWYNYDCIDTVYCISWGIYQFSLVSVCAGNKGILSNPGAVWNHMS